MCPIGSRLKCCADQFDSGSRSQGTRLRRGTARDVSLPFLFAFPCTDTAPARADHATYYVLRPSLRMSAPRFRTRAAAFKRWKFAAVPKRAPSTRDFSGSRDRTLSFARSTVTTGLRGMRLLHKRCRTVQANTLSGSPRSTELKRVLTVPCPFSKMFDLP